MSNEKKMEATNNQKLIAMHAKDFIFQSLELDNREKKPSEYFPILAIMCLDFVLGATEENNELELINTFNHFLKRLLAAFSLTFNVQCNVATTITEVEKDKVH
jgi:hypothetical protein